MENITPMRKVMRDAVETLLREKLLEFRAPPPAIKIDLGVMGEEPGSKPGYIPFVFRRHAHLGKFVGFVYCGIGELCWCCVAELPALVVDWEDGTQDHWMISV